MATADRPRFVVPAAASAALLLALAGCKASPSALSRPALEDDSPASPALTLPWVEDEGVSSPQWEHARRDADMGATGSPFLRVFSVAQTRHYERLRDVNGRPRNNAWTSSRSVTQRVAP